MNLIRSQNRTLFHMILSFVWLLPILKRLLMSFLPDSLQLLRPWIPQIAIRYPIFEELLVNVFALRWQIARHIPHLVNKYHVAISVTLIFAKQIGLAIEIGTIRTNQVVLILNSVLNSLSSLSKSSRRTDRKNWKFWTDGRGGLVVEVMISSPLSK